MGGLYWIAENWVIMLNAVGVVGGLLFTAVSLRSETKTRRIANLLTITTNHREIWTEFSQRPELSRVLYPYVNLSKTPITYTEKEFVNQVILHVASVHYAMKDELVIKLEGLRRDVREFFSLPIPRRVWDENRVYQNDDFVEFVEECRI